MSRSVCILTRATPPPRGRNGETLQKLVTGLLKPANGSKVSGSTVLVASARGYFSVTKVEFYLSGGSQHDTLIGTGTPFSYGWYTRWNTTTVANGTYSLRCVAYGAGGSSGTSARVSITVSN
jgi:hypothetical protein